MTTLKYAILLVFLLPVIAVNNLNAADFYRIEFSSNTGSTDNLLDESSGIFDAYTSSTLKLSLYPLSSLEFSLGGQQSYYREVTGLSSVTGQVGFTYLPISRTSPFALYLSGNFSGIRYHSDFNGFDNNIGDIEIAAGYNFGETISARAGFSYTQTTYISLQTEDKEDVEYFLGGNITLPGNIALDIESGFARANYSSIDMTADTSDIFVGIAQPDTMPRVGGNLWVFYMAPRISRIIAPKTGLNLSFTKRNFQDYEDPVVFGFTTQYLSPWASVWEGQSIAANLKTFLIPRLIITAGAGYWDKTFIKTLEAQHDLFIRLVLDRYNRRHDWQTKYYGSIQWPMTTHSGIFIEPSIRVDYTKNRSSVLLYAYSDYSFSAMITFRL